MCVSPSFAQTSLEDYAALGCRPIDLKQRSIYISYEGVGVDKSDLDKKSQLKVWLRLHNNLSCGIRIPTATDIEMRLPDGEKTIELLPDKARVDVIYYVQNYKQKKAAKSAPKFYGTHIIGWPILPPGRVITFGVPLEYFKKKLNVAVVFVYTWEGFNSQWLCCMNQ